MTPCLQHYSLNMVAEAYIEMELKIAITELRNGAIFSVTFRQNELNIQRSHYRFSAFY